MALPKLLTTHQVAEQMQVKETTVRMWLRRKLLRGVRVGKSWRVSVEDLEKFISGK